MNSVLIKFVKDYLVYLLFISFIFVAYFYTFNSYIHTKYAVEKLCKIKVKKDECCFKSNDLANNSTTSDEPDSSDENSFNSKKDLFGNYKTYNTVYELNDVMIYRFKMVIKNIYDTKLFIPHFFTLYYNATSITNVLLSLREEYYIFERKMRI